MLRLVTPSEGTALKDIEGKVSELRVFLNKYELPSDTSRLDGWYYFLNAVKTILGNFNNDVSVVATLLAKSYLTKHFSHLEFDACIKRQGASGLDVNILTTDGRRIIGEIKTVDPYNLNDFGAQQRDTFQKDFDKLSKTTADHKYLFLTQPRAFEVIQRKYRQRLAGVTVVCLTDGREFIA